MSDLIQNVVRNVRVDCQQKILFKLKLGSKTEKINPRWDHGIFVGVKRKSGELMLARPEGIHVARSARRVPLEQRWGEDNVNWVCWAPWRRYKDAPDGDGEVPEGVPVEENEDQQGKAGVVKVVVENREKVPKDFGITKKDPRLRFLRS